MAVVGAVMEDVAMSADEKGVTDSDVAHSIYVLAILYSIGWS